jgi:CRISPR-associated protein Csd2
MKPVSARYDFVLLFEVTNGNPNGDPDAGNAPRLDLETGHGIVTDVCIKRKIRNYISLTKIDDKGQPQPGYDIYVKERAILNQQHLRAYAALGLDPYAKTSPDEEPAEHRARQWMCENFVDIRMFGATMNTAVKAGQVRGPVQLAFSRSIDPVAPAEHSISRMAVTTEREASAQKGGNRMMGRKQLIPYAVYRCHGFVNPYFAAQTGFHSGDLKLLWEALERMFDVDRASSRAEMATRRLFVFEHSSMLGSAPAHKLFEKIAVVRADASRPPRQFTDYIVTVSQQFPSGIRLHDRIDPS